MRGPSPSLGGKLSEGCLLIPSGVSDEIIKTLSTLGVNTRKLEIYTSGEVMSAGQRL